MPDEKALASIYDCIIIGGGPAGLTCSIFLARYRRRVLIIDAGHPRNYASHGIHGFLGHHSIKPADLLRLGREEARLFGVEFYDTLVTRVEKVGDQFEVYMKDGNCARGRRLVLAYGVRDLLPEVPDLDQYYGRSIFHCPDCDGYEVSDKRVGVIGSGKSAAGLALKLLQWTSDITIFTNEEDRDLSADQVSKLQAEGISVHYSRIVSLDGRDGNLTAVQLEKGDRFEVSAIFFTIGTERSCSLAEDLGCQVTEDAPNVVVDEHRKTTVEGVWAVGDLVAGAQLAITSAADGAIAAIDINKTLQPPARKV